MVIDNNVLRALLKNVYFINGTAYAGKSTMVRMLAEKYDGICCGENFHDELTYATDVEHQPNLSYFQTMKDWQEFLNRTPEEYDAWMIGVSREAAQLEIIKILQLIPQDKKIFVDTNIPLEILKEITDYDHVAIMVSPQSMSVNRFFDREDAEKQFLYQEILKAENPEKTMENFRACLKKLNSKEHYDELVNSGFFVYVRKEENTIDETLQILEEHFGL